MQLSFEYKGHKYTTRSMKSRGTTSNLKILPPAAFYFKKEVVLAAHPPSCHPWRVFGNQERERKRREKRENLKAKPKIKDFIYKNKNKNLQLLFSQRLMLELLSRLQNKRGLYRPPQGMKIPKNLTTTLS